MKRWSKDYRRGLLQGLIIPALVLALLGSALAATGAMQQIDAMVGGINIYVDGVLQEPKNVKGEAVQPIAWQGTTYLPVRALTNMLTDKEVNWDQSTMSVYIGKQPTAPVVRLDTLEQYDQWSNRWSYGYGVTKRSQTSNGPIMYKGENAKFSLLNKTLEPVNRLLIGVDQYDDDGDGYTRSFAFNGNAYCSYMLECKYSELNGKFVVPYSEIGEARWCGVAFYSLDRYGEESLIKYYYTRTGDDPVDVSVPLVGVETLRIRCYYDESTYPYANVSGISAAAGALYDITLAAF